MVSGIPLNTNAYEFDHFSGSQIGIYIGDILVDDIAAIHYTVTQSKTPIFSYASQYFHTIADGQILVQGGFTIPFKESGYLIETLNRYNKMSAPIKKQDGKFLVNHDNIERLMERTNKKTSPAIYEAARTLEALSDEKFEAAAETFEDTLWHQETKDNKFLTPNLSAGGSGDTTQYRRADQYPPFDIWILYGDISQEASNHTIKKIIHCSIIGEGQVIHYGGEPILEEYQFIGKNVG